MMRRVAENATPVIAVVVATASLISAASPRWLPEQDLPPPSAWAAALGRWLELSSRWLLQLAEWLGGSTTGVLG